MARGGQIEIPIAVDTGGVAKAINNGIVEPVEDAHDALKKLGDADFGRDLDREMDKAQDATEDLDRELEQTRKELDKLSYAAKDVGDSGASNMDRVKGGAQELRAEIGSNLGEAVSSFRGDMQDIGQVGQDTLGGLAATVAGIGGAGGMLGALGLAGAAAAWGAFTQGQQEAKEKQEELNEAAASFAEGYQEGIDGAISAAYTFAEINSIATDPERYAKATKNATDWGVSNQTAMRAMAGDATALALVQDSLTERSARAVEMLAQQEAQVDENAGATYDYADSVKAGQDSFDLLTGAMAQGQQQARESASALFDYAVAAGSATDQTDDLGNQIVRLPDGKEIVIDANTRTAYEDIDALEARQLAEKRVPVRLTVDDRDVRNYRPPTLNIPGRVVMRGQVQYTD